MCRRELCYSFDRVGGWSNCTVSITGPVDGCRRAVRRGNKRSMECAVSARRGRRRRSGATGSAVLGSRQSNGVWDHDVARRIVRFGGRKIIEYTVCMM